jgi:hypothetical protein
LSLFSSLQILQKSCHKSQSEKQFLQKLTFVFIFFILSDKFSLKFWFEFSKKKASFVADFSQIQGKYVIAFISFSNSFGINMFFIFFNLSIIKKLDFFANLVFYYFFRNIL